MLCFSSTILDPPSWNVKVVKFEPPIRDQLFKKPPSNLFWMIFSIFITIDIFLIRHIGSAILGLKIRKF